MTTFVTTWLLRLPRRCTYILSSTYFEDSMWYYSNKNAKTGFMNPPHSYNAKGKVNCLCTTTGNCSPNWIIYTDEKGQKCSHHWPAVRERGVRNHTFLWASVLRGVLISSISSPPSLLSLVSSFPA